MDLDSLLDTAQPPLAPRDPALRQVLSALVDAAEASVRPRRRARRIAAVTLGAAVVLGGTVATTAAVGPKAWTSWLSGEGQGTCRMEIMVGPAGPDALGGEPNMWPEPFPYARRDRIVADARAFAASFDYAGIDRAQAIRAWQTQEAEVIAHEKKLEPGGSEVQPKLTGDELTSTAITTWMLDKLYQHLSAEGYDMRTKKGSDLFLLMPMTGTRCR